MSLCDSCKHAKVSCQVLPARMGITNLRFHCDKGHYDIRPTKKNELPKPVATCPDFEMHEPKVRAAN